MNDPYTARQHRNLARAQREYDDQVPEDEDELAEREARRIARDEAKLDHYIYERERG